MKIAKWYPWLAAAIALAMVVQALRPQRPAKGFDLEAFGALPVLEGGRVKPVDSVARNALLMLRTKQSVTVEDAEGKRETLGATRWLLDMLFRPELAETHPAFVVDNPDALGLLQLPQKDSRSYLDFKTISPHLDEIQKASSSAQMVEAAQRTSFQRAALTLEQRAWLYAKLTRTMQLPPTTLQQEIQFAAVPQAAQHRQALEQFAQFRPLPPAAGARAEEWRTVATALGAVAQGQSDPLLVEWARLGDAWAKQDAAAFNQSVHDLASFEAAAAPAAVRQAARELVFNRAEPFYQGMILYVAALLLIFLSWLAAVVPPSWWAWLRQPEALRRSAFVFLLVAVVVHTAGLIARIAIQGRPPVTNLYSSAVMVGWVAVVVAIVLEAIHRRGFGTLVAGAIGFGTLIIAHNLRTEGDTMEMMRAVLDSNFWLSTHVTTIIIGYGGTFLAGVLAILSTLFRNLAPGRNRQDDRLLGTMVYGVVCFSLFFSFIGTVLGGIWADQSWGRFWGWDPKENGALLIVLWNAIILHARWGGYAREKGVAAMAIFGNVITSLSWFGVNMLGVGLHSYGFMDQAFIALATFIASQLVLMVITLLPDQFWKASSWARTPPDLAKSAERPAIQ
jgi:ABC-type transport system involved in cytochrome c biogenesis permease subunit